jgi:cell pole-organizing protein PopZ
MRQDGEPSVEEILQSIKKVIARDNRESAEEERRRRERDSRPPSAERDEVLELDADAELVEEAEAGDEDEDETAPLIDRVASDAMRESLAALAVLAEPGAQPQIVRSGETSLEGLVRELLRPMLAQWLEKNLPAMVERMVAAEIARIAGKKG